MTLKQSLKISAIGIVSVTVPGIFLEHYSPLSFGVIITALAWSSLSGYMAGRMDAESSGLLEEIHEEQKAEENAS